MVGKRQPRTGVLRGAGVRYQTPGRREEIVALLRLFVVRIDEAQKESRGSKTAILTIRWNPTLITQVVNKKSPKGGSTVGLGLRPMQYAGNRCRSANGLPRVSYWDRYSMLSGRLAAARGIAAYQHWWIASPHAEERFQSALARDDEPFGSRGSVCRQPCDVNAGRQGGGVVGDFVAAGGGGDVHGGLHQPAGEVVE